MSEKQVLKAEVRISEKNGIFSLETEFTGTENVPLAFELAFRKGGKLTGVEKSEQVENTYLLKNGKGKIQFEEDEIEFGPGIGEHEWITIRGALPKPDGDCVYLTGFTPFKNKIEIG